MRHWLMPAARWFGWFGSSSMISEGGGGKHEKQIDITEVLDISCGVPGIACGIDRGRGHRGKVDNDHGRGLRDAVGGYIFRT